MGAACKNEFQSETYLYKGFFLLSICILNISRGVFNINCPFFALFPAFSSLIGLFFPGTFLYEIILEPEKKSKKIKSRIGRTLFPETF